MIIVRNGFLVQNLQISQELLTVMPTCYIIHITEQEA